ncbi:MAG: cation transporter [Cyanobacteria bacterium QH_1_48_107]|nr:MAG: cation transporter [Cyanobacteria bacterium QH_1_48_107]
MSIPSTNRKSSSTLSIVGRNVGIFLLLLGGILFVPLLVSLGYGETYSALSFLMGSGVSAAIGGFGYWTCRDAPELTQWQGMLVAAVGWLAVAAVGAVPLVAAAYLTPTEVAQSFVPAGESYTSSLYNFRNPLHAFFESMSAFTTTGLTMSVHEPSVGHGVLLYRSLGQWVGGAGMIVLALAILRTHGTAGLSLYRAEGRSTKVRPNIVKTTRVLWRVYVGLTLGVAVYLAVGTFLIVPGYGLEATLFDAVNHAMTGQSTGGFSTLDDSIAGYESYAMDLLYIPAMILGAISLPVYYGIINTGSLRVLWKNVQARTLGGMLLVGTPLLIGLLWTVPTVADPVREGLFQFATALSTTGWQTSAIGDWHSGAVLFIVFGAMIVGGSEGATVGGIKLIRIYVLVRGIRWQIVRNFLPQHAAVRFRLGSRRLNRNDMYDEISQAAVLTGLYLFLMMASAVELTYIVDSSYTLADIIFESATAQGTVGLSTGVTRPDMTPWAEGILIFQMWIGRLEIFPVFILLRSLMTGTKPTRP